MQTVPRNKIPRPGRGVAKRRGGLKKILFCAKILYMTDAQIIESLQKILNEIHDPKNGIFRNSDPETRKRLVSSIAQEKSIPEHNVRFALSGKDIYDEKLGDLVFCTGMAKVFLYTAKNSGLDLKAVITTEVECLNKGYSNRGHIVPAVKMSDGQYHIFEPRRRNVMTPDFQNMLKQPVQIGGTVFHIAAKSMIGKPYEVVDIIDGTELEKITTMNDIIEKSRRHNN